VQERKREMQDDPHPSREKSFKRQIFQTKRGRLRQKSIYSTICTTDDRTRDPKTKDQRNCRRQEREKETQMHTRKSGDTINVLSLTSQFV
jgi:hypothetical protein